MATDTNSVPTASYLVDGPPRVRLHMKSQRAVSIFGTASHTLLSECGRAGLPLSLWAGIRLPERPFQSFTRQHAVFTPPCYLWAYHQDQTRGCCAPMCDAPSLSSSTGGLQVGRCFQARRRTCGFPLGQTPLHSREPSNCSHRPAPLTSEKADPGATTPE